MATRTRHVRYNLDGEVNSLTLMDVLGSTSSVKRTLIGVLGESQATQQLVVSVDQDILVDISTALFSTDIGIIPVNIPLEVGQNVKAGFRSGATHAAMDFILVYEENY